MGRLPRRAPEEADRWEDGYVIPPTEPGLGVELNEDVATRIPTTAEELHLEMPDRREPRREA